MSLNAQGQAPVSAQRANDAADGEMNASRDRVNRHLLSERPDGLALQTEARDFDQLL
jgi:hypothetical protein